MDYSIKDLNIFEKNVAFGILVHVMSRLSSFSLYAQITEQTITLKREEKLRRN